MFGNKITIGNIDGEVREVNKVLFILFLKRYNSSIF